MLNGVMDFLAIVWDTTLQNITFINLLFCIAIVFFERKSPKSVWAWLLLLYFVPLVGFVFYLLLGADMKKRKMFRGPHLEKLRAQSPGGIRKLQSVPVWWL